jgi:hypothetical protein
MEPNAAEKAVGKSECSLTAAGDRVLDDLPKFTNIAEPVVVEESVQGGIGDVLDRLRLSQPRLRPEGRDQCGEVFESVSKGRNMDLNRIQAGTILA